MIWTDERIKKSLTGDSNEGCDIGVDGAVFVVMQMRDDYEAELTKLREDNQFDLTTQRAKYMLQKRISERHEERIAELRAENERLRALVADGR